MRNVESDRRPDVVRGRLQSEALEISEAAVQLRSRREVLAAKNAGPAARLHRQGMRHAQRIAELPGFRLIQIFLADEIFRDVPATEITGENQFQLQFALRLRTTLSVGQQQVRDAVVPSNF